MSEATQPEIPIRFDFETATSEIYNRWIENGCFDAKVDPEKDPYTIVIPPPNVTGALHLGHALNNTLQDIQIRMHRMMGYETLWMPGTDHAGIATQAVVERRLKEQENKTRHDLGREKLVERIWQWKEQYEARILGQLKRLGSSCDWKRTRFTLDERCAKAVRHTFFNLFDKSLIYRGKRLVNWDTFLQTAVSDDEVFHAPIKGHFWHIRYAVINAEVGEPEYVTIATTRPETLLGDTAVAVHPDPASQLAKVLSDLEAKLAAVPAKEKPAIEKQIETCRERQANYLPTLERLTRMANAGRKLRLPLLDREIPLITDEWAKPELGSGCVKITPAHDVNDYEVGLRASLPMLNILNPDGTLNAEAGPYASLSIMAARQKVVSDLEEIDALVKTEDREIDLAHSDRSKTPIEPYLADQWFVRMDSLAQSAMDAVSDGRIAILPERYAKGYLDWLSEKRDWPVGRQLWWGHQIPIWTKEFASASLVDQEIATVRAMPECVAGKISVAKESSLIVHVCIQEDDRTLESRFERLGYVRQEDVLDTWFSSALWPHSTLGWPDKTRELEYFYPTATLITSRDIITLWVARMVLMGINNLGEVPFRKVYIHPKILDGYGETMSKSKGNGVDPIDVIEKFGPDALRFGLAWLATETQDVRMPVQYECPSCQALVNQTKANRTLPRVQCDKCSIWFSTQWAESQEDLDLPKAPVVSDRFENARNFTNKLWNASRFVMLNLDGFQPTEIDLQTLPLEDRWILSRLATANAEASAALEAFKYADAMRVLYDFAWQDFCSYYVEIAKPRMQDSESRPIVQQVLAHVLDHLLRLLHPVVPFVTEAIWEQLANFGLRRQLNSDELSEGFLIRSNWPVANLSDRNEEIEKQFSVFASLVASLREIRNRQNIGPKDHIDYALKCDPAMTELLTPMQPFVFALAKANCTAMGIQATAPDICSTVVVEGMDLYVDLGAFIDVDAEIERTEKLLANIVKQVNGKQSKLANENFVSRAPDDVVQKERDSLSELLREKEATEIALKNLRNSQQPSGE